MRRSEPISQQKNKKYPTLAKQRKFLADTEFDALDIQKRDPQKKKNGICKKIAESPPRSTPPEPPPQKKAKSGPHLLFPVRLLWNNT